jgi:hypothetical protein
MLRLDPAFPPLWRSATTLQFGADPVVVIDDPEPWQQRLIRELESGIPDASLDPTAMALGAPENAADTFVRRIARALCPPATPRPRIALQSPHGFPPERLDLVAESLGAAGVDVSLITWFGAPAERVEASAPVVVLAHHVVEPRRAAALMSGDIPHLPLVFTGSGAEIGPFVVPGRTPCLACLAAHRCDADPAWPLLVAQLLGRPAPAASRAMVTEASFVTARLISEAERQRPRSLTLRADSLHRSMRAHRPHAECRCRSLAGIATAAAPAFLATTTSTVLARPA